jgi:hypothetical protein
MIIWWIFDIVQNYRPVIADMTGCFAPNESASVVLTIVIIARHIAYTKAKITKVVFTFKWNLFSYQIAL